MKKKATDKQKHAKKNLKQSRFELRLSCAQHEQLADKAKNAGLTMSKFVRSAATGKTITPIADQKAAVELRRIGAMLKHLYPKDANWTAAEKRQYWVAMHTLLGVAKGLDGKITKKDGSKIPSNLNRELPNAG